MVEIFSLKIYNMFDTSLKLTILFPNYVLSDKHFINNLTFNQEAETFSEQNDLGTKDLKEIASQIANMPKINTNKPRTVVITHGSEPTVVAVG